MTVVAVHVATGLFEWALGYEDLVSALLLGRSPRFRIDVGAQFRPLVHDGELWRLATASLLHADALHLLVNGLAILTLGWVLEPWIGGLRFLSWFVLGALGGAVLSDVTGVLQSDGASGGAFALLGGVAVLAWRRRESLSDDERRWLGPVLWGFIALNLVLSAVLPFVNLSAHVGGLGVGAALGMRFREPTGVGAVVHSALVAAFVGMVLWGIAVVV